MNHRLTGIVFAAALALPAARILAADEPKEGMAQEEKAESPQEAQHEVQKAQKDYNHAVNTHGAHSKQAKSAKKKLDEEKKKHPQAHATTPGEAQTSPAGGSTGQ